MVSNRNSLKVCFYARAGQLKLYVAIAKQLMEEKVEVVFVTQEAEETKYVRSEISTANVYEIEQYLKNYWDDSAARQTANDLIHSHNDLNVWRMLYTDRFLVNYGIDDAKRMIELHFLFYHKLFEMEKPDFFVNEAVAIFSSYVALVVGKHYQCRYLGMIIARDNARKQFFFFEDLYQRNAEMERLYHRNDFSESEIEAAKSYLRDFRERTKTPSYMEKFKKPPRMTWKFPLYPIKYLLTRNHKKFKEKSAYMTYNKPAEIIMVRLTEYLSYRRSRSYYQPPRKEDDYYLFPLHYQPEASTLVCAEKYEKQLYAIDNIAKSLPYNSVLYVKEHYACLGHRKLSFYKELSKYPNVRLIDPYSDIHTLIKNSKAVIVLTNTTGFEAILHGKKVFVLGEVFYDFFNGVEKLSDVYHEAEKLKGINNEVSDNDIVRFICAYKKSLKTGCVHAGLPEYLLPENINNITESLKDYIQSPVMDDVKKDVVE